MNRDPEISGENMEHFDPTRYLDASGDIGSGMTDGHFTYGFWPPEFALVGTGPTTRLSST